MSVQIDDKNIKFGEKQCENIAMFYLKAYSNPLEYTVQGMNNVIKSLNEKLQKVLEIKFLSSNISLCNADVGKTLFVLLSCLLCGIAILLPFWLVAFIIVLACTKSFINTWQELNPAKMIKECFFSK